MKKRWTVLALSFALGFACSQHPRDEDRSPSAFDVAREFERVAAERVYWPDYAPLQIPLAIYDGERTLLFRHPSPPDDFESLPDSTPAAYAMAGRHPKVDANSSAEIGGVLTATLMMEGSKAEPRNLAATALHEAFHVHQRTRFPKWGGNEMDALLYPIQDAELLALRRMETEGLRRAFATEDPATAACWTKRALQSRRTRFDRLGEPFISYERGNELNEGLATYVQSLALEGREPNLPEAGFPAQAVRSRAYDSGSALALLLDRHSPQWTGSLSDNPDQALDVMLWEGIREVDAGGCAFSAEETASIRSTAERDAGSVSRERVERRREFESKEGWRIIIEADSEQPLGLQRFDPSNVHLVQGGVLHTRMLKLGNDAGQVELLGATALTEAAGSHPLFSGIGRLTLTGLDREPEVEETAGTTHVRAPGLDAKLKGARIERSDKTVHIRLSN